MPKFSQRQIVAGSILLLAIVILAMGYAVWEYRESLPPIDEARARLLAFLQSIPVLLYFLAFVILPSFGVPLTLFYLTAIPIMGTVHPGIAILLGWTAVGLNMALTNVLTRGILHPVIEWVIRHRHLSIPKLKPHNEWKIVLTTRLSPLPFALQNYLLALGHARWHTYLWLSLLIQGAIGLAVMLLGESVLKGGLGYILLAVFAFLALNLLLDYVRKRLTGESGTSRE
jgi:uncharacterized membrane protein YdjX (TVP38/TMEM64 family)